ncbi:Hsp20 family protein [Devosia sp. Leaf64]|uniref:Hsp20 family protein n=1 Tax=Devosia sp. Leaf64 TaxID=1736229 RepID=UPI000715F2A3|nr:Hsp20 family protein [Devosia sp. Leaf64]KQN73487.1 molecular chaperone Hsp20 [Devosia sp. Leaf64]
MRTNLDFAPLYRSSIGFDRMFNLLESASRVQSIDSWPLYDIVKMGDDDYQITMAVAGFTDEELTLTSEPNLLVVEGRKAGEEDRQYLYRGISGRTFQRRFELADHVKVNGASLANGLLTVDLKREIPEAKKPRRIEIRKAHSAWSEPRQIEDAQRAA